MQDAVSGDRLRQLEHVIRRWKVTTIDLSERDESDYGLRRRAELFHVVGVGTHPVVARQSLTFRNDRAALEPLNEVVRACERKVFRVA